MSKASGTSVAMRFIVAGVLVNLVLCVFLLVWKGFASNEVVYVDTIKIMKEYKGVEDAKQELTAKMTVWQANLDTLRAEAESAIKEYEATQAKASARERTLMENLIQSKQEQYMNYEQTTKEQMQKQDQELTQKVLDKVNDYLKRYGKKKGYQFILAATQYGNIVYAEDHTDITDEVLEGLNAEYTGQ